MICWKCHSAAHVTFIKSKFLWSHTWLFANRPISTWTSQLLYNVHGILMHTTANPGAVMRELGWRVSHGSWSKNVIFWCANLPRTYSTHIWKLLTTFLKSAQQEKQETVVKQEKGKSHGSGHSFLRFVPYVLTVICPYIRTVYRVTLRIAHLPAAWVDQIQNLGGRSLVQSPESRVKSEESRVQSPESRVQSPESRVQSPESDVLTSKLKCSDPDYCTINCFLFPLPWKQLLYPRVFSNNINVLYKSNPYISPSNILTVEISSAPTDILSIDRKYTYARIFFVLITYLTTVPEIFIVKLSV